jgi:hypothetical protein
MIEAIPYFLWVNDCIRSRELLHGQTCVQVNPDLLIGFIGKLAAIE